jgi:hypothetical protein
MSGAYYSEFSPSEAFIEFLHGLWEQKPDSDTYIMIERAIDSVTGVPPSWRQDALTSFHRFATRGTVRPTRSRQP